MPMTIQIVLNGICASYKTDAGWRVVLFCDKNHRAKFKNPEREEEVELRNGNDRAVSFLGAPAGPPDEGDGFDKIFNLSAKYAHDADGARSFLNVVPDHNAGLEFVVIDIPNSKMSKVEDTPRVYWVQPKEPAGFPVTLIGKVASKVAITFEIDEGDDVSMHATNPDVSYKIPYREGGITISIDNDCKDCKENDFPYVYNWLEDKRDDRRFFAGQVNEERFEGGKLIETKDSLADKSLDLVMDLPSPTYGNCDPVVVDPPPGP